MGRLVSHTNNDCCKSEGDGEGHVEGELCCRGKGVGQETKYI